VERVPVVDGIDLELSRGEVLALVGESGSGKTMLALAVMGLLPAGARLHGEAQFVGEGAGAKVNLTALTEEERRRLRGRALAMIFQEPMTALNPVMRVGAQIEEAVRVHQPALARSDAQRRVLEALTRVAVPEPEARARQYPHQLSGGLRQRAMIAMALASGLGDGAGLRLLIADEPTTALDVTVQKQILELLARLQAELGLALLFITHDLGVAAQIARRIAVMYAGRIVEEGPAEQVLRGPLHPYTQGLLRAAPRLESRTLEPIPGTVPQLHALPPGCAFAPRCPVRRDECNVAMPEMRYATQEHASRCVLIETK
jgi:peptide/nickel transport system ATP-binding protein